METSATDEPGLEVIPTEVRKDRLGRRTLGRERRDELLSRFATSGMTQAAFARKEGVSEQTFASWRKRVRKEGKARPASTSYMQGVPGHPVQPAFRELTVAPPPSSVAAPIVVVFGGVEARCADAVTAAALIKALREAP